MPCGRFPVGILPFIRFLFVCYRRLPLGHVVVALALETQFPDVVDNPLEAVVENGAMLTTPIETTIRM